MPASNIPDRPIMLLPDPEIDLRCNLEAEQFDLVLAKSPVAFLIESRTMPKTRCLRSGKD